MVTASLRSMERRKVGAAHDDVKLVERRRAAQRSACAKATQLVEVVQVGAQRVHRRALLRRQVLAERRERLVHGGAIVAQRAGTRANRALDAAPAMGRLAAMSDAAAALPGPRGCPRLPALRDRAAAASTSTCLRRPAGAEDGRHVRRLLRGRWRRATSRAVRPLPRALRLPIEADAALRAPARRPRAGHRLSAAGAPRRTIDVAACPIATPAMNARLAELRAEVRGALVRLPAGRDAAGARGVLGRDDRSARRRHRAGRRPELQFLRGRLLPEQPVPAAAPGRARRRRGDAPAARASWSTPTAAAACWGSPRRRLRARRSASRSAPAPCSWARENAARNGRDNCDIHRRRRERGVRRHPVRRAPTPPSSSTRRARAAATSSCAQLCAFAPRTIVYVSCNPETQARDLVPLAAAGYACLRVQPFDMFPQTRHLECVATLSARRPDSGARRTIAATRASRESG